MVAARIACLALLTALLLAAAWGDIRRRTIPNRLNAAIALLAIAWWPLAGLAPLPDMVVRAALAAAVFAGFAGLFTLRMIGGGDVKLAAAIALWLPPASLAGMLVYMGLIGGILAVLFLILHKMKPGSAPPELPYGVAIVGATLPFIPTLY